MTSPEQSFRRFRDAGDVAALGAVFDAVATELLLVASHVAPPGVDPQDLVGETFVDAIECAARWDDERPLVPWLLGILGNHARRARQRQARALDADRLVRPVEPSPLDLAELDELGALVHDAIRGLPRQYRQVIVLKLVHGLGPAQIATALACPLATVKTRLRRGLDQLRRALPAGIGASLAAVALSESGLAAVRAAVLGKAAAVPASLAMAAAAASGIGMGLAMKKLVLAAALVVIGSATWFAWPEGEAEDETSVARAPRTVQAAVSDEDGAAAPDPLASRDVLEPRASRELASDPVLFGRVVDAGGAGVPDVFLGLRRDASRPEFRDLEALRWHLCLNPREGLPFSFWPADRTRSGPDGRFAFHGAPIPGEAALVLFEPTRSTALVPLPRERTGELLVELPDEGQLFGVVSDDAGRLVGDATVDLADRTRSMSIASARTNERGEYRFIPWPAGAYSVRSSGPRHVAARSELVLGQSDQRLDFRLVSHPILDATLVDDADLPWTAARILDACGIDASTVHCASTTRSVPSYGDLAANSGSNEPLAFDPATGRIRAAVPKRTAFVSLWWRGVRLGEATLTSLDAPRIVVALVRPTVATLHVRLRFEPHAAAPPSTRLTLARSLGIQRGAEEELRLDGFAGTFTLPASEGATAWHLGVAADGYTPIEVAIAWPAGEAALVTDILLSAAARSLHGVVVDAADVPVRGANLWVIGADGDPVASPRRSVACTDEHGVFRIEGLPARDLRLIAGAGATGAAALDVPLDAHLPLRIALEPVAKLAVRSGYAPAKQFRVLDAAGRVLLDDRFAAVTERSGDPYPIAVPAAAHVVEVFRPGDPEPFARGVTELGAADLTLAPLPSNRR